MLSSYFIRSSLLREAISTIFSSFSKTALRALKGSLFSVSIFLSIYIQRSKSVSHSSSSLVVSNKRIYPVSPIVLFLRRSIRLHQQWLQQTFHRTLNCGLRKECLLFLPFFDSFLQPFLFPLIFSKKKSLPDYPCIL